jgi:pyruvate/2-oxoglutarate dehydrogenase complex dihydrolipoamide acyltransferase (E2) component
MSNYLARHSICGREVPVDDAPLQCPFCGRTDGIYDYLGQPEPTEPQEPQASSAAAKLAAEYDIDLADVPATGAEGRVGHRDVQGFIKEHGLDEDNGGDSDPDDGAGAGGEEGD